MSDQDEREPSPDMSELQKELGEAIQRVMPDGWGFALYLFQFGKGTDIYFVSSGMKEDVYALLSEWLKRRVH